MTTLSRWPERIAAGSVSDYLWAYRGLLPTAGELAGVKPAKEIDQAPVLARRTSLLNMARTNYPPEGRKKK